MTLEDQYRTDPVLLVFYKKRLVKRGWAGKLSDEEREYLNRHNPEWRANLQARMARQNPTRRTRTRTAQPVGAK